MRMLTYGVLMTLALSLGWAALSHADDFRPFSRKPTLATDLVVDAPKIRPAAIAS